MTASSRCRQADHAHNHQRASITSSDHNSPPLSSQTQIISQAGSMRCPAITLMLILESMVMVPRRVGQSMRRSLVCRRWKSLRSSCPKLLSKALVVELHLVLQQTVSATSYELGGWEAPAIPIDEFRHNLWHDPRAGRLNVLMRVASAPPRPGVAALRGFRAERHPAQLALDPPAT
jgi:hypothetical protein